VAPIKLFARYSQRGIAQLVSNSHYSLNHALCHTEFLAPKHKRGHPWPPQTDATRNAPYISSRFPDIAFTKGVAVMSLTFRGHEAEIYANEFYIVSRKKSPAVLWHFFRKRLGIFNKFCTPIIRYYKNF